jgi:poly(3-hydroxybutyrate) depolymerase
VAVYDEYDSIASCGTETVPGGAGDPSVTYWCDGTGQRVSKVMINGMGHAWPSGGNNGYYINGNYLNYPAWITKWFFDNNRRVNGGNPPIGENSLILNPPTNITLNECDSFVEPGFTATDAVDGDIAGQVLVTGNGFDSCVEGEYTIEYSVTFSDSSSASETRAITVEAEPPVGSCTQYTDNNYNHTLAGRAHLTWGLTYANGSNDYLGLWNVAVINTLAETSPGYFKKGNCP